jgi:hypothetical protein
MYSTPSVVQNFPELSTNFNIYVFYAISDAELSRTFQNFPEPSRTFPGV